MNYFLPLEASHPAILKTSFLKVIHKYNMENIRLIIRLVTIIVVINWERGVSMQTWCEHHSIKKLLFYQFCDHLLAYLELGVVSLIWWNAIMVVNTILFYDKYCPRYFTCINTFSPCNTFLQIKLKYSQGYKAR